MASGYVRADNAWWNSMALTRGYPDGCAPAMVDDPLGPLMQCLLDYLRHSAGTVLTAEELSACVEFPFTSAQAARERLSRIGAIERRQQVNGAGTYVVNK